ncbi:MAG: MerR family transcriptional regulator, partial [Firmicutes bacterium]|nr:MerR family transcriptional regulator [Bacillota bacterium]
MLLTVGEVAEVLGLTSENIRYYVKEGLIKPARNTENNYRQYSSNDVLLISDIIFYRNMRISINNIKKIMSGIPLEDIGSVIEETEREMLEKIKEYTLALEALQSWKKHYSDEYAHLGRYS